MQTQSLEPRTIDILAVAKQTERKAQLKHGLQIGVGIGLAAFGATRHSLLGALIGAAGVTLLARTLLPDVKEAGARLKRSQRKSDSVDQASLGSFPASDPPANSPAPRRSLP